MSQTVYNVDEMGQVCAWRSGTMGTRIKASNYSPGDGFAQSDARGIPLRDLKIQLAKMFRGGCRGESGMDSGTVTGTKQPKLPYQWKRVLKEIKKKGLILPSRMKAQVGSCVKMTIIVDGRMLMGLKMRCWIERKNMVFMIELMSENFAIKRPAECIGHHGDKQYKHDEVNMAALVHGSELYTYERCCQYLFF